MSITPLKPSDEVDLSFCTTDIETWPDGTLIAIDTCWRSDDGRINHQHHFRWLDWYDWIKTLARDDSRFRTIYAHNGCGFDWLSLLQDILENEYPECNSINCMMAGSRMVSLFIGISGRFSLRLCDSFHVMQSSLDKLAKTFLGHGKVETDNRLPHELWENDRDLFWRYLRMDTEALLETMEAFRRKLHAVCPVQSFGLTIASTTLKAFRTSYLDREIMTPQDETVKAFLREGYHGGRVELFKPGEFNQVRVYDINSLYPSVMRRVRVPVSNSGTWVNDWEPGEVGCYRIRFTQSDRSKQPVLTLGGDGAYEGEGVFYNPELELAKEQGVDFEVIEGYRFMLTDILFDEYIEDMYRLRLSDKNGPMGIICKNLMNHLYGKFAQKPESENVIQCTDFDELQRLVGEGNTVHVLDEANGLYRISGETEVKHEHVAIAGIITSEARATLYRAFNRSTIYCDTDSIHTTEKLDSSLVSDELGRWKLEYEGSGVYVGKKLYALRNSTAEKVRAKGVRVKKDENDRNGFSLTYNQFRGMLNGESVKCEYYAPTTPRETIEGKQSCQFRKRKRTLRMLT